VMAAARLTNTRKVRNKVAATNLVTILYTPPT
jgi:hypothetical protein